MCSFLDCSEWHQVIDEVIHFYNWSIRHYITEVASPTVPQRYHNLNAEWRPADKRLVRYNGLSVNLAYWPGVLIQRGFEGQPVSTNLFC